MIMYRILRLHTRDNKFKLSSVKYSSILFFYRLMADDETTELGSIFHTLTSLFAKKNRFVRSRSFTDELKTSVSGDRN